MSGARNYLAPAAVILVLLGAWELAARWDLLSNALNIQDFLVPAPSDIATSLWRDRSLLADDSWVTLREVLLGFLCALVAGLAFAVVLHLWRPCGAPSIRCSSPRRRSRRWRSPRSSSSGSASGRTQAGADRAGLLLPITVNTLDELRSVDPQLITMMRTLGASRARSSAGSSCPRRCRSSSVEPGSRSPSP